MESLLLLRGEIPAGGLFRLFSAGIPDGMIAISEHCRKQRATFPLAPSLCFRIPDVLTLLNQDLVFLVGHGCYSSRVTRRRTRDLVRRKGPRIRERRADSIRSGDILWSDASGRIFV